MPDVLTLNSQWISLWPSDGTAFDLRHALEAAQHSDIFTNISAIQRSIETAKNLSEHPILAVTGQLNAGKSSVVASFLSPSGRARVPRGYDSCNGTHRFVYWVPQSWLDDELFRKLLLDLIATAHPNGVEFLDASPEIAAEQYRSGRDHLETLSIPLIAGDPLLDGIGIGLLDCPDIQTHDDQNDEQDISSSDNPRLDFLSAAARVCSAFVVVWNRAGIQDKLVDLMLSSLRQRMASAPLYLLVNMIRPEEGQPQKTMGDSALTRLLEGFSIAPSHVYGAFDFKIPGWEDHTPARLVEKFHLMEAPQFYPLAEGIHSSNDLLTLTENLDTAEIQQQKIADHQAELVMLLRHASETINQWLKKSEKEISTIHQGLLDTCHGMMTNESSGEPLQVMSPEFSKAIHDSFVKTAPLALKIPLKLADPYNKAYKNAKKWISTLNPKSLISGKVDNIESKLNDHFQLGNIKLASSENLARRMQSQRWCPANIEISELQKAWNKIIEHFHKHPIKHFDTKLLEEASKAQWSGFSLKDKLTIGLKALLGTIGSLAALGGLATLAVDGGATFFAATSISHAINAGVAATIAVGGGAVAIAGFEKSLLENNTLPYLSRLFSITCDCFRIPRTIRDKPAEVTFKVAGKKLTPSRLSASPELPNFPVLVPLTEKRIWDKAED